MTASPFEGKTIEEVQSELPDMTSEQLKTMATDIDSNRGRFVEIVGSDFAAKFVVALAQELANRELIGDASEIVGQALEERRGAKYEVPKMNEPALSRPKNRAARRAEKSKKKGRHAYHPQKVER